MNPIHLRAVLALLLGAALLAGCAKKADKPEAEGATAKAATMPGGKGAAAKPKLLIAAEDVRDVTLRPRASGPVVTGSIQPARRADLRAEVGAVVLQVLKDNGDPVRTGDLLMRLDATSIRDNLASAEEATRAATQAYEQAERTVARLKSLQSQGMTSVQALEDAEVRRNSTQSDMLAAKARVVAARQQLSRTEVRAPFDGVVSERKANAGDTAAVGKELVKVIDPRSMRFEGRVSSDRLAELKLGQQVLFRINGVPGTDFAGTVQRVDASANTVTRQVEVLIGFVDGAAAPKVAGLYAEGRIQTGSRDVMMLPEAAITRAGDTAYVWRLKGQQLQRAGVQLGARDERSGELVVTGGLAVGEKVLRRADDSLVDGQAFEWSKPAAVADAGKASNASPSAAAASR